MPRWFNTAGSCKPELHYILPALRRLPDVRRLVDQQGYFVLHAPRQAGKTTALLTLARELTREGRYTSALVSMEVGASFPDDIGAAELAILQTWRAALSVQLPPELQPPEWPHAEPGARLNASLHAWAKVSQRPLVIFLDEVDALRDNVLISILRQIRDGYRNRPEGFPWSLALIGVRDVRDYKVAEGQRDRLGTSSPFNIKVESLTLRDFTDTEVAELYAQHTAETGQPFEPGAVRRAFELSQGQPWLVNALARQLVEVVVTDPSKPITAADVDRAKALLITRRDTHLDSLIEALRDRRIRAIIEPMLAGTTPTALSNDDVHFAIDLGLVRLTTDGGLDITNPIYREIIARELAFVPRASLPQIQPTWLTPDGRIDARRLLDAFLAFWRRHGEPLLSSAPYHEVAPHLVLMAFLDRVVNGGGTLEREYAIGRGRMDLCLRYGPDVLAIEIKVWRDGQRDPLGEGLEQLDGYLTGLGLSSGWLVIFDRRASAPPVEERTTAARSTTPGGREVFVVRA
jgi:type II secretory pathway predicted ATPase ExeA